MQTLFALPAPASHNSSLDPQVGIILFVGNDGYTHRQSVCRRGDENDAPPCPVQMGFVVDKAGVLQY